MTKLVGSSTAAAVGERTRLNPRRRLHGGKFYTVRRMDASVRPFLDMHRTTVRWLDDIIDVLIERRGTAHFREIARDVAKAKDARDKDTVEQIVTRRLNDFCSDAADFSKDAAHDLFERIGPATYRLRSYPERPNVIELVRIEFDDMAMQSMWDSFKNMARQRHAQQWRQANNEKKLSAFVKWMAKDQSQAEYERRKAQYSMSGDSLDALFADK